MNPLTLALAQLNLTVGDLDGNLERINAAALAAHQQGARLLVCSELALTGYPTGDLLDEASFLARVDVALAKLNELSRAIPDLYWAVGTPIKRKLPGKALSNGLIIVKNGEPICAYAKQLLPTYNVFNEHRYFEPGPDEACVLDIDGVRVGFLICEDSWNDMGDAYPVNPFARMAIARPDLVVTVNASPSNIGKREERQQLLSAASARYKLPMVYVNQVGGHDQLVFDGASFAATPEEGVVFEAKRFSEDLPLLRFNGNGFSAADGGALPAVDKNAVEPMAFYRQQIVLGLRDYVRRCGFKQVVVGSSGGIDSAVTLALAVEALGSDNVIAVTLPSRFSSSGSVDDSQSLAAALGIRLYTHPIKDLVATFERGFAEAFGEPLTGLALENLQARARGAVLMEYSNQYGALLLTTGNKSELSVGYCTLYGDTNGGLGLLGDLYKTEVFELARHLNQRAGKDVIPQVIIDKPPSAELAPNQKDTDSLPPYPVLDTILKMLIEGEQLCEGEREEVTEAFALLAAAQDGAALIARVQKMIWRNEYKRRQAPPILRLRPRAFGSGRQMPIAATFPEMTTFRE